MAWTYEQQNFGLVLDISFDVYAQHEEFYTAAFLRAFSRFTGILEDAIEMNSFMRTEEWTGGVPGLTSISFNLLQPDYANGGASRCVAAQCRG